METVVLPAHDHLAQERYRHQSRVMSGMIYTPGGLPRTRRKVKSPAQVFAVASMHSEPGRLSSSKHVYAAEPRNGAAWPIDMSLGVLRSAPSSASTPPHRPMAALGTSQYGLHNTSSQGFVSRDSSSPQRNKQVAGSFSTSVLNGVTASPVLRTRTDGELSNGLRKGLEVEKTFERRRAHEKESLKQSGERKVADKPLDKGAEKLSDRRKGPERRAADNKKAAMSSAQVDPASNIQKKVGVITILQRPQTKEAAAENMAIFAGRPVEVVTVQASKSDQMPSQPLDHVAVKEAPAVASAVEDVRDAEAHSKDKDFDSVHPGSVSTVSPNKIGKKKTVRDYSWKVGSRLASETLQAVARSTKEREKQHLRSLQVASDWEARSTEGRRGELSPPSPSSAGEVEIVSDLTKGVSAFPTAGVLLRGRSDSFGAGGGQFSAEGKHGRVIRSGSFREVPRANESSVDLSFLASSPPKNLERWAGPAYTNSPPPSTLPLPTFPIQRVKTSLTSATVAGGGPQDLNSLTKSSSAPASPSRVASMFFSASASQTTYVDPLSATKDLRRLLNLDVDVVTQEDVASILLATDILRDSATQSLKKILQLC